MLLIKNLPFVNVVSAGIASLDLPLGMTYERIVLNIGGDLTKSLIDLIEVKLNGKTFYKTTGDRQDARNKYRGIYDAAGFLTLDFTEIRARDQVGQSIGAVGTAKGVSSLRIEVTINAGSAAPTIASYSEQSAPKALSVVNKVKQYVMNIGAAGTFPLPIPYGANGGSLIKRVGFFHTNMTGIEVKQNGLVIHKSVVAVNEFIQQEKERVPQGGLYMVDFLVDGNMTDLLNTTQAASMEWNVDVSGADTVTAEVELIDPLGNL